MVVKNGDEFHGTIRKITKKENKQWTFPWLRNSASALKGSTSAEVLKMACTPSGELR